MCNMLLKITLTLLLTLAYAVATNTEKQQNQTSEEKFEDVSPKFTYGYKITSEHGSQEKQEQRDGEFALGRYNVQGADSIQTVEYLADDLGFHPLIQYSNIGPHSISSTRIAFGTEAVKALQNSQKSTNDQSLNQNQEDKNSNYNGVENNEKTMFYPTPIPNQEDQNSQHQNIIYVQQESPDTLYQQEGGVYLLPNQNFMYAAPTPSMYLAQLSNNYQNYAENNQLKDFSEESNYGSRINVKLDTKLGTQTTEKERSAKFLDKPENLVSGEDVLNINAYFNSQTESSKTNAINLEKDPIVVLDENNLDEDKENFYSTTQSTIETVNTEINPSTSATLRPVSNIFLAPITAGLRLSSNNEASQDIIVEVEKSRPLYLGNFNFNEQNTLPIPQALIQQRGNSASQDLKAENTKYTPQIILLPEGQEKDLLNQASQYISQNPVNFVVNHDEDYSQQFKEHSQDWSPQPAQSDKSKLSYSYTHTETVKPQTYPDKNYEPQFSQQLGTHKEKPIIQTNAGEIIKEAQYIQVNPGKITKVPYITKLLPQKPHSSYKYKIPRPVPKYHHYPSHLRYKNLYQSYAPSYVENYQHQQPIVRPQRLNYNPYIGVPFYGTHTGVKPQQTIHSQKIAPSNSYSFHNSYPLQQHVPKQRTARQSFGSNLRIEYGFMPPFLPSVEIDEQGRPLEKNEE